MFPHPSKPLLLRHPAAAARPAALVALQNHLYHETKAGERPVRQLMTWLLDRRNLEGAWDRVRGADGAATPGVDGVTCHDVAAGAGAWLARLCDDLYHRRYQPSPVRWFEVPKPNRPGATRRLGILTVQDRVVHAAVKQVLEPLLEPAFLDGSFGFRPGRSVPGALQQALRVLDGPDGKTLPFSHGAQLDVADCFDTIDHDLLRAELARHVADPDFLHLVDRLLAAGGTASGRLWWHRRRGLVQGSPLSPLLCNLYLHPLDQALHDLGQATQNGVRVLRYADDLLLLGRDARTAERGVALVRQVLRRLQQKLKPAGAGVVPVEAGLDWLGVRLRPRPCRWADGVAFGYVVPDAKVASMLERVTEMTLPPSDKIDGSAFNPARWIVSINQQLRDWRGAYLYADNAPDVFRALDDHARERVAGLLQAITGVNRYQVFRQYKVRLPRGFWTWEVPGARLTVLSSLAPHAPANLTRRPAWMGKRIHQPAAKPVVAAADGPPVGAGPAAPGEAEPAREVG